MVRQSLMDNIFIATTSFGVFSEEPLSILNNYSTKVSFNMLGRKLNDEEIISLAKNSHGIIAGTENYSKDVLKKLSNLRCISRLGVGMDNVDLDYAKNNKITVFKTNTSPGPAVAELVMGLIVDVSRKISHQSFNLKSGLWQKEMGLLLKGKTLGIIGLGNIGKQLVKISSGFRFKILAYDLFQDIDFKKQFSINYCDLDQLLINSDIISIHLNSSNETLNLINEKNIQLLKPSAILINTSRGDIVDEGALYKALNNKKIFGAGIDVFKDEPYTGPLKKLNNVVLTPHIGSYAKEIRIKMEIESVKNLLKTLKNEKK